MKRNLLSLMLLFLISFSLAACSKAATESPTPTATEIPVTPTATPVPMALIVNDEGITLEEYQADLARLQKAQSALNSTTSAEDQKNQVIENFTDMLLLEQAAKKSGYTVDDATLQGRIDDLATKKGGAEALASWESTNGYTADSFKTAELREIYAIYQRDQIINAVPETADQVHARQILVQDEANAESLLAELKASKDFATLAATVDPTTGGDLGWFPKGYLTEPAVGDAAFALEAGQFSDIIQTELGYHIVYVIERDANHPLSVGARKTLQQNAIAQWLKDQKAAAQIQVLVQ
jgi:peptidyl-prolyl cis-trans isomerase C